MIHLKKAEIRKDPYAGVKWKLNYESDCFSSCKGGACPSYCGSNGFCCSGDEEGFLIEVEYNQIANQMATSKHQFENLF